MSGDDHGDASFKCTYCGRVFTHSGYGPKRPRHCSASCRVMAWRKRQLDLQEQFRVAAMTPEQRARHEARKARRAAAKLIIAELRNA